jgi:hypothetical protein
MRWLSVVSLGLLVGLLAVLAGPWPPPRATAPVEVTGVVTDGEAPLAGAVVRLKGGSLHTYTDANGWFHLPSRPGARWTAWQPGFLIAGARDEGKPLHLRLERLPAEDHEEYAWVDPAPDRTREQACANCHAEIYREWLGSGHSRSATGRHFRNLYDGTSWDGRANVGWGLVNEHPDGAGVCAACHAPAAPESAFLDLRQVRGPAGGIHCDYCHKIADVGDSRDGLNFGRFAHRLLRPAKGQLFFGPLDDVDRGEDSRAALYRDSRYCASCHEGVVFGVHVYSTYSEWLESPARREGKQCQHCHMAPTGKMTNFAPGHGGIERDPATLGNHRFFQPSQAAMLARCLRLSVESDPVEKGTVCVRVCLSAQEVGHRVPTGFIDRQLVLVVEGSNAQGQTLALQDGPRLPAAVGPELVGQPGRLFARLLHDEQGRAPVPFWRAEPEAQDTRLQPGKAEEMVFTFPAALERVRVRVLSRRFWDEVVRSKGWPQGDQVVVERVVKKSGP